MSESWCVPVASKTPTKLPPWPKEDLAKTHEVSFGQPVFEDQIKRAAQPQWVDAMATINLFNLKARDGFVRAMQAQRTDLRGLPFLLGDECRTEVEQAKLFRNIAVSIRDEVTKAKRDKKSVAPDGTTLAAMPALGNPKASGDPAYKHRFHRATVAALMQILMAESASFRIGLAKHLATIPHADASMALAKMAIYSPEKAVP